METNEKRRRRSIRNLRRSSSTFGAAHLENVTSEVEIMDEHLPAYGSTWLVEKELQLQQPTSTGVSEQGGHKWLEEAGGSQLEENNAMSTLSASKYESDSDYGSCSNAQDFLSDLHHCSDQKYGHDSRTSVDDYRDNTTCDSDTSIESLNRGFVSQLCLSQASDASPNMSAMALSAQESSNNFYAIQTSTATQRSGVDSINSDEFGFTLAITPVSIKTNDISVSAHKLSTSTHKHSFTTGKHSTSTDKQSESNLKKSVYTHKYSTVGHKQSKSVPKYTTVANKIKNPDKFKHPTAVRCKLSPLLSSSHESSSCLPANTDQKHQKLTFHQLEDKFQSSSKGTFYANGEKTNSSYLANVKYRSSVIAGSERLIAQHHRKATLKATPQKLEEKKMSDSSSLSQKSQSQMSSISHKKKSIFAESQKVTNSQRKSGYKKLPQTLQNLDCRKEISESSHSSVNGALMMDLIQRISSKLLTLNAYTSTSANNQLLSSQTDDLHDSLRSGVNHDEDAKKGKLKGLDFVKLSEWETSISPFGNAPHSKSRSRELISTNIKPNNNAVTNIESHMVREKVMNNVDSNAHLHDIGKSCTEYPGNHEHLAEKVINPRKQKRLSLKKTSDPSVVDLVKLDTQTKQEGVRKCEQKTNREPEKKQITQMQASSICQESHTRHGITTSNEEHLITLHSRTIEPEVSNRDETEVGLQDSRITEDMLLDFENENFLVDFQFNANDLEIKKRDKTKPQRRSSRYFSLHEMPLSEILHDQHSTDADHNSSSHSSSPDVDQLTHSPVLDNDHLISPSHPPDDENKENTPEKHKQTELFGQNLKQKNVSAFFLEDMKYLTSSVTDDVTKDFLRLCVKENSPVDQKLSLRLEEPVENKKEKQTCNWYRDCVDQVSNSVINVSRNSEVMVESLTGASNHIVEKLKKFPFHLDFIEVDTGIESGMLEDEGAGEKKINIQNRDIVRELIDVSPEDPSDSTARSTNLFAESSTAPSEPRCLRARSRKSWDFTQATEQRNADKKAGIAKKKRQSGEVKRDGTLASLGLSKMESDSVLHDTEASTPISIGLENLYRNKNYVLPPPRAWETIKENPGMSTNMFTKQRYKRFLVFDDKVAKVKLQRRHKRAVEMGWDVKTRVKVTDDEFSRKMLDLQLFLESPSTS